MRRGICGGSVDSPAISGVWVAGVAGVRDISGYICVNTNTWSPLDTCHLTISPTDVLQTRVHSICLLSFSFIFTPSTFSRLTFYRAQSAKFIIIHEGDGHLSLQVYDPSLLLA